MTRTRVISVVVASVLALTAWGLVGGALGGPDQSVAVERRDLVLGVDVTGTLRAVESSVVGPPQVEGLYQFKIAMMAPEGSEVRQGQPVVGFDTSELQQRLQQRASELAEATQEVEKKRVDLTVQLENDRLALAEAEAKLRRARLKASQPSELVSDRELEKAHLDLELARFEVDIVTRRLDAARRAAEAELEALRADQARAQADVDRLQSAIQRMTRGAPRDGIVVYHSFRGQEKLKVGDTAWVGRAVVAIPDLSRMAADGEIEEALAGRIRVGQPVTLRLDAHPDLELAGRVDDISRSVRQRSWRIPIKIVRLDIALDTTDPDRMRPGMRFRGTIETDRFEQVLVLPLEAVWTDDDATWVVARQLAGWRRVPVTLGARTTEQVEITAGLAEGDVVSLGGDRG